MRVTYTTEQDRTLSEDVLQAIEAHRVEDLTRAEFVRYEDSNPKALDTPYRHGVGPRTTVEFDTGDAHVELHGDDGVEILVRDRPAETSDR